MSVNNNIHGESAKNASSSDAKTRRYKIPGNIPPPKKKERERGEEEAFTEFSFESTKQALQYFVSDTGERKVKN